MEKVLILGATGMLGHKLMQVLPRKFDVTGTVRGNTARYKNHPVLDDMTLLSDIQAGNFDSIIGAVAQTHPDVIINCIGIIKQHLSAKDPIQSISINALFPHRLARLCQASGTRLIHISTDCVFSGKKGDYSEDDIPDPEDLYGRTKLLGEVATPECLTIRTSIIGRELQGGLGLIDWFLSQKGKNIRGFVGAKYTGFTTLEMAEIIIDVIKNRPGLSGVWHVSSNPISKYDLLNLVNRELDMGITIEKETAFFCDRRLNSTKFRQATGYKPPSWDEMIHNMVIDGTPYDSLMQ
jgi:dTDP-4-dehydrorhamnose reductase